MDSPRRSRSSRPPIRRSWQLAKIALQVFSLVCCAIVMGLSASATWQGGAGMGILIVPIAIGTSVWTLAELVTVCVRWRQGRGIHPGAHVAMQLIIFLALILALFYSCLLWKTVQRDIIICEREREENDDDWTIQTLVEGEGFAWSSFYCPMDYYDLIHGSFYQAAIQAIIAFVTVLWVIHFSLFVRACVETQRRNRERPVTMVYAQPVWPAPYGAAYPPSSPQGPIKETEYR
ncbi:hypothetical protein F5B20DRAFT_578916 [Whalleya microplaca]|nr:hypothetical protein F5B20DRAFT_578916 [Whalleya microplaca]